MAENELMHHGVKGQKKGEHRFGKWQKHALYAHGQPDPNAKPKDPKTSEKPKTKAPRKSAGKKTGKSSVRKKTDPVKKLSDEELQRRINRLRNEQAYKELVRGKPSLVSRGAKTVSQIVSNSAKQTATKYVSQWMDKQVKNALENRKKDKK